MKNFERYLKRWNRSCDRIVLAHTRIGFLVLTATGVFVPTLEFSLRALEVVSH